MTYTPTKPHSLRRCTSCANPFVTDAETPLSQRCERCERDDVPSLWVQQWERSKARQRDLRKAG